MKSNNKYMKLLVVILIVIMINTFFIKNVFANGSTGGTSSSTNPNSIGQIITNSLTIFKNFLISGPPASNLGKAGDVLVIIKNGIKMLVRLGFIALAGVSAIQLSIIGILYIRGMTDPKSAEKAQKDLWTVLKAIAIGFGGFFILEVIQSILRILVYALPG